MEKFARKYANIGTDNNPVWELLPDECKPAETGQTKASILKFKKNYKNRGTVEFPVLQIPRPVCGQVSEGPEPGPIDCLYETLPAITEVSSGMSGSQYNNVTISFSEGAYTYIEEAFSGDTQEITVYYRAYDSDGFYYGDYTVSANLDDNWQAVTIFLAYDNPGGAGGFIFNFDGNQSHRINPNASVPVRESYNTQFFKKNLLFDIKVSSSCLNEEGPISSIECKNTDLTLTHSSTLFEVVSDYQLALDWTLISSDTTFGWQVPDNQITFLLRINDPNGIYVYGIDTVNSNNEMNWKVVTPQQFNLPNGFFRWRYVFSSSLWRINTTGPGGTSQRINVALNPAQLEFEAKAINSCSGQTYFTTKSTWSPPPSGTKWAAIETFFFDETNQGSWNTDMAYAVSVHTFRKGKHEELLSGKAVFNYSLGDAQCTGSNCKISLGTDTDQWRKNKQIEVRCNAVNAATGLTMTNPHTVQSPTCGDFTLTNGGDWFQPLAETVRPAPDNNGVIVIGVGTTTYAVYRQSHQTSFTQTPNPALHVSVTKAHQWSFALNSTRYDQIEADLDGMGFVVMAFEPNVIIGDNTYAGFRDWQNQYGELANLMIEQTKR